jgi:outer membrane protein assembly factor BamB
MKSALPWFVVFVLAGPKPICFAGDWPQWRGPHRNSISGEHIKSHWPAAGPKVIWSASVGTGFSGISISRGYAFTMGNATNEDTVWCFDARTGALAWKHSYPAQLSPQWYEGGPGATPTVESNRVYTISKWGDVFCFNAASGSIVWQRDLRQDGIKPNRWGFAGSPLIWHDLLILNAGGEGTALDRNTGRIVWSNGTNATGYASPMIFHIGDTESVLIFAAQQLVALDPRTGAERWRYPWKTDWDTNNSDPIVYDDCIFLSSFSRGCALLSLKNGSPEALYDTNTVCNNLSPGVLLGQYYYVFSGEAKKDTQLRCLHLPTGQLKWSTKEPAFGSIISADGALIVLTEKGELLLFGQNHSDPGKQSTSGPMPEAEPVARAKVLSGTCWTPPSLANGLLYVRNAKGELRCLDMSSE